MDVEDFDLDENEGYHDCPKCNRSYDEVDYDYQFCSKCGWDAVNGKYSKGKRKPTNSDYMSGEADILTERFW